MGDSVNLQSSWRQTADTRESDVQTDPVEVAHQKTQEPRTREFEVQTEPPEAAVPLNRGGFQSSSELDSFLMWCTPLLEDQLKRNLATKAFDGHDVSWGEQHDTVSCLHSLKHRGGLASSAPESCTAVAWNASGSVVAAAYGALDRNDWPVCSSMLCTWSIFRRQLDPQKADLVLELSDCLTCLAFHPEDPSLLAGGSYNGDVLLWRLSEAGDPLIGKSVLTNYTHHEPVQKLAWTREPGHGYVLASVSADGKMLTWSPADMRTPASGHQLIKATSARQRLAAGKAGGGMLEGAAAFGFSRVDPTTFVAGLETGTLHKGSLIANEERTVNAVMSQRGELPWSRGAAQLMTRVPASHYHRLKLRIEKETILSRTREVQRENVYGAAPEMNVLYHSPVTFTYEAHSGPVYEAQFSPFHRNLFLTASTDSSIRLYNVLQPRPVHVTEPCSASIFGAAWSPARPLVFAAAAADGNLYIYDMKRSKGRPDVTLKVTDDRSAVHAVSFNPRNPELLATADAQGFVKVWQLSHFLSNLTQGEQQLLDRMAATRGERGDDADADGDGDDDGDAYDVGEGDYDDDGP